MGLVYSEPACQSAYDGDVHRLYEVLRRDPNGLNVQDRRSGDTPLIAACRRAKLPAVQYLLHNRADVHLTNKKQRTCLHYAAKRTLTLFDHIVIIILMPILLLGYFLMLQKKRKSVALMQEILKSDVNVSAVDYVRHGLRTHLPWPRAVCNHHLMFVRRKETLLFTTSVRRRVTICFLCCWTETQTPISGITTGRRRWTSPPASSSRRSSIC